MDIEFKDNKTYSDLKDILIKKNNKILKIFYGGTGDLFFDVFGDHNIDSNGIYSATFNIDQNDELYHDFEELINDILNCNKKIQKKYGINSDLVCDGVISWYSDEIYDEKANLLKIRKVDNCIVLTFFDNPDDSLFGFAIRISNSGSKYEPFNICFMDFFNKLQEKNKILNGDKIKKIIH